MGKWSPSKISDIFLHLKSYFFSGVPPLSGSLGCAVMNPPLIRWQVPHFVITVHLWHIITDTGCTQVIHYLVCKVFFTQSQECLSRKCNINVVMLHLPCVFISSSLTLSSISTHFWLSQCVTLCSFCVSVWKLGTPNYRGLSVIMYLTAEMYWRTVPPWKKRTPNINWGILLLRSISMFLTVIFIPSDLNKYLCLGAKKTKWQNKKKKKSIWKLFHQFRQI